MADVHEVEGIALEELLFLCFMKPFEGSFGEPEHPAFDVPLAFEGIDV